jgi:hypothetical protein
MAVQGRVPARHEDVFPVPVVVMSVDAVEDFEKRKAGAGDPQERDKETGMRLWAVSLMDPSAQAGKREVKVKMAADHQPVPPNGIGGPVEFDGLVVIPWLDDSRSRPRVAFAYRAAGFRVARKQAA